VARTNRRKKASAMAYIIDIFNHHRSLLYYKGDISGLILFAQQENGSVCFPEPLPFLSSALE
jgi:hypothetical protein